MSLRARNVSFEKDGKKYFRSEAEIPAQFVHSRGDAIALSPGGWRPLAFIPNGASVLFDKNAFSTVKNHIDVDGNPQTRSLKVVVDFWKNRDFTVDLKPILMEGNNRKNKQLPTYEEMVEELEIFEAKLRQRLPNIKVLNAPELIRKLHEASSRFFYGFDAILVFIEKVHARLEEKVKFSTSLAGFKEVLTLAKEAGVLDHHLIFAAVVFKAVSGEKYNPIYKLLKFNKPNFIEQGHSFNGTLDIFSLMLFLSEIRNRQGNAYFITADKDLIYLWNDMVGFMIVDDQPGVLNIDMNYFLPGLSDDDIAELVTLMS
ncbi:hypothetical protein D3C77_288250 [compost metagenome]